MAYTALARKWRPRTFAEMTGQEHVLASLSNALASGRVHHAFLFAGTRGVGASASAPPPARRESRLPDLMRSFSTLHARFVARDFARDDKWLRVAWTMVPQAELLEAAQLQTRQLAAEIRRCERAPAPAGTPRLAVPRVSNDTAASQNASGGLFRNSVSSRRGVIQSPVVTICRATAA